MSAFLSLTVAVVAKPKNLRGQLEAAQQLAGWYPKATCQLHDRRYAEVSEPSLGSADLDRVHVASIRQRFLGDAEAFAVGSDILADLELWLHADDPPR